LEVALRRVIQRAMNGELVEVPPRVRFEMRRKVLHVVVAILSVPMLLILPFVFVLAVSLFGIGVIAATWAIERRRIPREFAGPLHEPLAQVLEKTRRPGEDFPWSPVLYTFSLILIALAHEFLGLSWALAFAAYAILGIGDAASALVGVAYGRTKLPWNRKKSIEGTLAGMVAGFFAGVVLGAIPYGIAGQFVPPLFLAVVFGGALAGALAETLPRVEDNFVVPLTSAAVMLALANVLALPLPP
jgi:dolichol kinase